MTPRHPTPNWKGTVERFFFSTKNHHPGDSSHDLFIPKRWVGHRSNLWIVRVTFSPGPKKGQQQNCQDKYLPLSFVFETFKEFNINDHDPGIHSQFFHFPNTRANVFICTCSQKPPKLLNFVTVNRLDSTMADCLDVRRFSIAYILCILKMDCHTHTVKQTNKQTKTNRQTDRQTDRKTDRQTNARTNKRTNQVTNKRTNKPRNEQTNEQRKK